MINIEDVKYLEGLIKIRLTDEKRKEYAKQIDDILEYIKEISNVNLNDNGFAYSDIIHKHNNIFREDEILNIDTGHTQKALSNARDRVGDLYKVSQVLKQ